MKHIILFTTLMIPIHKSQVQDIGINSSGASTHAGALPDLTGTSTSNTTIDFPANWQVGLVGN